MPRWSLLIVFIAGCGGTGPEPARSDTETSTTPQQRVTEETPAVANQPQDVSGSSMGRRMALRGLSFQVPGWEREQYEKLSDAQLDILCIARQIALEEFDTPMWFTHPDVYDMSEIGEVGVIERFGESTPMPLTRGGGSDWRVYKVVWDVDKSGKRVLRSIEDDDDFEKYFTDLERSRIDFATIDDDRLFRYESQARDTRLFPHESQEVACFQCTSADTPQLQSIDNGSRMDAIRTLRFQ